MVTARPLRAAGWPRHDEAGFNLVILVVAIAVMNILVAMALPLWRTAIQRDKEEELIFRGWQYAEGIRVFQHRFGRLPVKLEELMQVHPRCMRQLWEDPITGKRDWVVIHVGVPDSGNVPPPKPGGDGADDGNGDEGGDSNGADTGNPPGGDTTNPGGTTVPGVGVPNGAPGGAVTVGPIRGVRSRSGGKAIKRLFDQDRYDRWQFTVDLLGVPTAQGVGVPSHPVLRARWIGRPFRPGIGVGNAPPPNAPPPVGIPGGTGQPKQPPITAPPPAQNGQNDG